MPSDSVGGALPQGRLTAGSFFSRNYQHKSTNTRKTDDSSTILKAGSSFSRNYQQKSTPALWLRRRFGEIPNLGGLKSLISGPQILVLGQGRLRAGSFFSRNYQQKSTKTRKTDDSSTIFNNLTENERQFNKKTDPALWLRRRPYRRVGWGQGRVFHETINKNQPKLKKWTTVQRF